MWMREEGKVLRRMADAAVPVKRPRGRYENQVEITRVII